VIYTIIEGNALLINIKRCSIVDIEPIWCVVKIQEVMSKRRTTEC